MLKQNRITPPWKSKKVVLKLRSVNNIVIALLKQVMIIIIKKLLLKQIKQIKELFPYLDLTRIPIIVTIKLIAH